MLAPAILHESDLQKKHATAAFDPHFAYAFTSAYGVLKLTLVTDTWEIVQLVSVNKKGDVLGYISMGISRPENYVSSMAIYCYTDNPAQRAIVAGDLKVAIQRAFVDFHITKIIWSVLVGNPVERMYDRLCSMMGGRIVGTFMRHNTTSTGIVCDTKWYEVLSDDFHRAHDGESYTETIKKHVRKGGSK